MGNNSCRKVSSICIDRKTVGVEVEQYKHESMYLLKSQSVRLKKCFIHLSFGCILIKFNIHSSYDIIYHRSVLDIAMKNCDSWYLTQTFRSKNRIFCYKYKVVDNPTVCLTIFQYVAHNYILEVNIFCCVKWFKNLTGKSGPKIVCVDIPKTYVEKNPNKNDKSRKDWGKLFYIKLKTSYLDYAVENFKLKFSQFCFVSQFYRMCIHIAPVNIPLTLFSIKRMPFFVWRLLFD